MEPMGRMAQTNRWHTHSSLREPVFGPSEQIDFEVATPRCRLVPGWDSNLRFAAAKLTAKPEEYEEVAPEVGFEPTTNRLTADRSTTELLRNPDSRERTS
jgi:hypothetical protein